MKTAAIFHPGSDPPQWSLLQNPISIPDSMLNYFFQLFLPLDSISFHLTWTLLFILMYVYRDGLFWGWDNSGLSAGAMVWHPENICVMSSAWAGSSWHANSSASLLVMWPIWKKIWGTFNLDLSIWAIWNGSGQWCVKKFRQKHCWLQNICHELFNPSNLQWSSTSFRTFSLQGRHLSQILIIDNHILILTELKRMSSPFKEQCCLPNSQWI